MPKLLQSTTKPKSYVVTVYVDALSAEDIGTIFGQAADEAALLGVNIKNWIIDDDETPELHQ